MTWKVVSAKTAGVSHLRCGAGCQDAFASAVLGEWLFAAVSDGAGSAAMGGEGAETAVEAALAFLVQAGPRLAGMEEKMRGAACAAQDALQTKAVQQGAALRDLACTLLLAAAGPEGIASLQIGDGAVVAAGRDGSPVALTRPPDAEYANETDFLVSEGAMQKAQIKLWNEMPGYCALFTDGLQRLALQWPGCDPHLPFFQPLFRFAAAAGDKSAEELQRFLQSPKVAGRTDDDITLILAALE